MSESFAKIIGAVWNGHDYAVQQYRVRKAWIRFEVYGALLLPKKDRAGRLRNPTLRWRKPIQDHLSKEEAFTLANSLNALNNLPRHEPPAPRKAKPKS